MFRRSDGNTSISPENIAGQSLSVGFRPLPQTTPYRARRTGSGYIGNELLEQYPAANDDLP
ncbi:hypothetical protein FDK32_26095 [Citrobacter freundii]|uniref:Uncharacterized protein n=1 Tax=Aeromonas hydrophila TaxID=644 RepID=A0ABD7G414_AERHY|nr:hypothetical protein AM459_28030 [Klebsiella pneumoniae]AWD06324.1 hypothetical protein AM407_25495 [Klebsiella aerogenes]MBQ5151307.1 hypothetical protein [Citrobacter freundii]PSF24454.1 hypothetical protein C6982_25560 [Escherichia coli]QEY81528.1 hypothetical protein C2767_28565 [Klebsiella quasipneumoniae]RCF46215.1 hypothetical protein C6C11_18595 [Aeromonas hydrophila]